MNPRLIKPELINVGDKIRVDLPASRGIVSSSEGTVSRVVASADQRFFMTDTGGTIGNYTPGKPTLASFTLVKRPPENQVPLFD